MDIKELEAMGVAGDAYHDRHIFDAAAHIIHDIDLPMVDRIRALQKIDDTMGIGDTVTADDVHNYLKEYS